MDAKLRRYEELEALQADPEVAADRLRYNAAAKEQGALAKIVQPYMEFLRLDKAAAEARELLADPEMRSMAEEELATIEPRLAQLQAKIEDLLLVDPAEDFDRIILEIRAGTGGDEAALFAGNLFEMYTRYAREHGWEIEEIDSSAGDAGGYKEIILSESGGHRVQRVPKTETQGRIHTSLATVGVMPEPDEVQVEINPADLEIEVMRAGGAGGQHVNKTESAVRIWYRKGTADELEVKCQDGRSQHKNKEQAMRVLRSRVFEQQQARLHKERSEMRRTLIGGGDRSARIRTYNFPDGRVTDHRIGLTVYKIADVLMGELDHLVQPLREHDKKERLEAAR
jgi:peptide chain release factor 1